MVSIVRNVETKDKRLGWFRARDVIDVFTYVYWKMNNSQCLDCFISSRVVVILNHGDDDDDSYVDALNLFNVDDFDVIGLQKRT